MNTIVVLAELSPLAVNVTTHPVDAPLLVNVNTAFRPDEVMGLEELMRTGPPRTRPNPALISLTRCRSEGSGQ